MPDPDPPQPPDPVASSAPLEPFPPERDTDPDLPRAGRKRTIVDASKAVRPGRQVFGPSASGVYHHPTRKALKRVGGVAGVYPRSPVAPKPKAAQE